MPSLNNAGGTMPVPVLNVENGGLEKGNVLGHRATGVKMAFFRD